MTRARRPALRPAAAAFQHVARPEVLAEAGAEGTIPVSGQSCLAVHARVSQSLTWVLRVDLRVIQTINLPHIVIAPVQAGHAFGRRARGRGAHTRGVRTFAAQATAASR